MAADPFEGPTALVARARSHIAEFEASSKRVFSSPGSSKRVVCRVGLTGWEDHKLQIKVEIPLDVSCIAYDAMGCLRSALDHAVFAAAGALEEKFRPWLLKFPFGKDRAEATNNAQGIPASLREIVLGFEPYQTGDKLLWGFNRIRNIQMHRAFTPFATQAQRVRFRGSGSFNFMRMHDWDDEKKELTYLRGKDISPGIIIQTDLTVAFGVGTDLPLLPVVGTLSYVADTADKIIAALKAASSQTTASSPKAEL